jgi:catechol 2,3-dioxygenase-like lactoylglutathione lyase family enzyme
MRITRLELLTSDLIAQRDFYSTVLELPAHLESDSLSVKAGSTDLFFRQAPHDWEGAYHFCFNIPENQFVYAKAWLSARIPLVKDEEGNDQFQSKTWNSSSIYFKDTAGNILEFIARHDQQNAVHAPFESEQILQVSEIGLASRDVISFAKELCEMLGVSAYKQEPKEAFTPIGDEDGLLILPIENRIWYPNTGIRARMLSVQVNVDVNGKAFTIRGVPYEVIAGT